MKILYSSNPQYSVGVPVAVVLRDIGLIPGPVNAVVYSTVLYLSKCMCAQVPVGESLETEHALIMAINASSTMDVFFYSAYSREAAGRWGLFSHLSTDLLCCVWGITSSKGDGGESLIFLPAEVPI